MDPLLQNIFFINYYYSYLDTLLCILHLWEVAGENVRMNDYLDFTATYL
jgi:uncharacterized membrane protein YfhO